MNFWLPVKQQIEFKILLITLKALNNQAPIYLIEILIFYTLNFKITSLILKKPFEDTFVQS